MKTKKLVLASLFVAVSLGLYALEVIVPPLVPVPGVKLGLANIVTLVAIYTLGRKEAFAILVIRIILSTLLFGQAMSFLFSLAGGAMSFGVMAALSAFMDKDNIWAISVFGAFAHNFGQIFIAIAITEQFAIAYYFMFLVISSVITGCFNGLCSKMCIKFIEKSQIIKF